MNLMGHGRRQRHESGTSTETFYYLINAYAEIRSNNNKFENNIITKDKMMNLRIDLGTMDVQEFLKKYC